MTTLYHFFFVPVSISLAFYLAIMQTAWYRTGKPTYLKMVKFWSKLFLICFAVGVAGLERDENRPWRRRQGSRSRPHARAHCRVVGESGAGKTTVPATARTCGWRARDAMTTRCAAPSAESLTRDLLTATADRATVLITHRLSALERIDEIIVLHEGVVAERGTHDQLLAAGGPYTHAWQSEQANGDRNSGTGWFASISLPFNTLRLSNTLPI